MSAIRYPLKNGTRATRFRRALALIVLWTMLTMSAQAVARPTMLWLRAPWGGLVAGALMGMLQWTALGSALSGGGWWIAETSFALGLASFLQGRIAPEPAAILTGALVGLGQWLVLRRTIKWSAHWILVSAAVAWPAASLALVAVAWLTPRNSPMVAQVLAGALQGVLVGAGTGILLATLLPGEKSEPSNTLPSEAL
ncbi:MAG: hypothetical protein R6X16_12930 [Anaerolineae bacterium]